MFIRLPETGWAGLGRTLKGRKWTLVCCVLGALIVVAGIFVVKAAYKRHEIAVHTHEVFQDPRVAALAQAAAEGEAARVRQLAKEGVNLNAHGHFDDRRLDNITVLEWAMFMQSPMGFEALLDAGANPEEPGIGNDPAILMAADAKDPVYLKILLAHGVDPSKLRNDQTPLQEALLNVDTDAPFYMLLQAGADPDVADSGGNTALISAAAGNRFKEVLALLKAGANPYAKNKGPGRATFQAFLRMTPADGYTEEGRQELAAIDAWLRAHHVPITSHFPRQ